MSRQTCSLLAVQLATKTRNAPRIDYIWHLKSKPNCQELSAKLAPSISVLLYMFCDFWHLASNMIQEDLCPNLFPWQQHERYCIQY